MSEVIDRGILEISADVSKLEASMLQAKRSIKDFGDSTNKENDRASASIDRYVKNLQTQAVTFGKSANEAELFRLKLRGASEEQLKAAEAALALTERQKRLQEGLKSVDEGVRHMGEIAVVAAVAAYEAFDKLIEKAAHFKETAQKIGDTASAVSSLAVPAAQAGIEFDAIANASVRLNKNLSGTDEQADRAAAALKAIGVSAKELKTQGPVDQLSTIAKALAQFRDSAEKGVVLDDALGKGAHELLPFFHNLAEEGARNASITDEQSAAAMHFRDESAKLRTELMLQAAVYATDLLPILTEAKGAIVDYAQANTGAANDVNAMTIAGQASLIVFQSIAVFVANVAYVFKETGIEIGGILAQLDRLAVFDFKGFSAISDAMKADADRARAELDKFETRIMNLGKPKPADAPKEGEPAKPQPTIKYQRPNAQGDSRVNELAKAQLALDISRIKAQSDAITSIYSGSEKILEALRQADLVDERTYLEAKTEFLRLNGAEQVREFQAEIDRLQQIRFVGKDAAKDRAENDKKIEEARNKLTKAQNENTTSQVANAVATEAALRRTAKAYSDSAQAASLYIATLSKRADLEVGGIGKGDKFRQQQSDLQTITEGFQSRIAQLDKDRLSIGEEYYAKYVELARVGYQTEVSLYLDRTRRIEAAQGDWVNGFTEAAHNYIDTSKNLADSAKTVFDDLFKGLEDSLTSFITTGKGGVRGLLTSIQTDVVRMGVRQTIGQGLQSLGQSDSFGGFFKALSGAGLGDAVKNATGTAASAANTTALTANTTALTANVSALVELAAAAAAAASALTAAAASAAVAGAGSSAASLNSGIFGSMGDFAGVGKAVGGPVSAGGVYPVNERGPELLSVAGKEYLMVGSQGGSVTPIRAGEASGGGSHVSVYVTPPPGSSRQTAMQWGAEAGRHIQLSMRRNGK